MKNPLIALLSFPLLTLPLATAQVPLTFNVPAQFEGDFETIGTQWALVVLRSHAEAVLKDMRSVAATNRTIHAAYFTDGRGGAALPLVGTPSTQQLPDPFGAVLHASAEQWSYFYIEADFIRFSGGNISGNIVRLHPGDSVTSPLDSLNYPTFQPNVEAESVGFGFKADEQDFAFGLRASGVRSIHWSGLEVACSQAGTCPDSANPMNRSIELLPGYWTGVIQISVMELEGAHGDFKASGQAFAIAAGSTKADLTVRGSLRLPGAKEETDCSPCLGASNQTLRVDGNVSLLGLSPGGRPGGLQGTLAGAGEVLLDEASLGMVLLGGAGVVAGAGAVVALGALLLKVLFGLFTRYLGDPRDHPNGRLVFEAVQSNPGWTYRRLMEATGFSDATVRHHLKRLEGAGHIVGRRRGNRLLWFENHGRYDLDWGAVATLRDPALRALEAFVAAHPGVSQKEILDHGEAAGDSRSTVKGRLDRLVSWGLLAQEPQGRGRRYRTSSR